MRKARRHDEAIIKNVLWLKDDKGEAGFTLPRQTDLQIDGLTGDVETSALTHSEGTGMRLILARMVSAGLVQTKGLGFSLCSWM